MTWNRRIREQTLAREFRRALYRSAADQAVAEAERTVRQAWAHELAWLQALVWTEYHEARAAREEACAAVREMRAAGDLAGLVAARREMRRCESDLCGCMAAGHALAEVAGEQREVMAAAEAESGHVADANRNRVRAAWTQLCAARRSAPRPGK